MPRNILSTWVLSTTASSTCVITKGVDEALWIISDVAVEVDVSAGKADGVFAYKFSYFRVVPAVAVIIEPRVGVILASRVAVRGGDVRCSVSERVIVR